MQADILIALLTSRELISLKVFSSVHKMDSGQDKMVEAEYLQL